MSSTYYDPVSDDDTILGLIEEMDQEQYAKKHFQILMLLILTTMRL